MDERAGDGVAPEDVMLALVYPVCGKLPRLIDSQGGFYFMSEFWGNVIRCCGD